MVITAKITIGIMFINLCDHVTTYVQASCYCILTGDASYTNFYNYTIHATKESCWSFTALIESIKT